MKRHLPALLLALLMGSSGVLHFVSPKGYQEIVPGGIGSARNWVAISGVAELMCAALLVAPRTRRFGSLFCIGLLVAVFPANVYAALQGGYESFRPPFNSQGVAIARLPLQAVLIWWAWRIHQNTSRFV